MELLDAARHDLSGSTPILSAELFLLLGIVRHEFVQRRIDEANGDRETIHGLEDADKIAPLEWPQLGERLAAGFGVVRDDHLLDGQLPVGARLGLLEILEEHVLGAAEADAFGAHFAGLAGVVGRVGVGAHAKPPDLVGPLHHDVIVLGHFGDGERHLALDRRRRHCRRG